MKKTAEREALIDFNPQSFRLESKFRRYFRHLLKENGVWTAAVEHRSGGTAGIGDLLVQCREELIPVELKVGEWSPVADVLHCSRIRPAQIRLLSDAQNAGIRARLVIGVQTSLGWQAWLLRNIDAARLARWRKGFGRNELEQVALGDRLLKMPPQW